MSVKTIIEQCREVIDCLYINTFDSLHIIEVSRLAKSFHPQFTIEEASANSIKPKIISEV